MSMPPNDPRKSEQKPVNPYQSSIAGYTNVQSSPAPMTGQYIGSGTMVRQVGVIAGLMIAQAVLLLIMAVMLIGMAIVFPVFLQQAQAQQNARGGPAPFGSGETFFIAAIYGSLGFFTLVASVLQIWAAIKMFKLEGRTLGITAVSIGLVGMLTCYCGPTAIGLAIYGLIVLLNPSVAHAFNLRKQGLTKEEVMRLYY